MTDLPIFAVIIAGGQGTRLWPLSREARPKQFLSLGGSGQSLLQEAVRRARFVVGSVRQVLVTTQSRYADLVREQLPELPAENLILEPVGRNTAPCLGLAAKFILGNQSGSFDAVMLVLPADHLYKDEAPWLSAVRTAIAAAIYTNELVAIGIQPTEPSPNYGYLHLGDALQIGENPNASQVFKVVKFVEKPALELARGFCETGDYLWNTGTFAWRISIFQHAFQNHLPGLYAELTNLVYPIDPGQLRKVYPGFEAISVDYGIIEKASNVVATRGDFERIDLGSLAFLNQVWPDDPQGNATIGEIVSKDSQANIIYTDQGLVGLIGVQNMVVIRAGEVLLVCPRERVGEVKSLIQELSRQGRERYL
jgi:mannose-1-phosphate guanylyltransferase